MSNIIFSADISDTVRKNTQELFEHHANYYKSWASIDRPAIEQNIEAGLIDLGATNSQGDTPLHLATAHSPVTIVQTMLDHGADINARNSLGRTPLHDAALLDKQKVLKLLLDHGAEKDSRDHSGRTPLYLAARGASHGSLQHLIDRGADINMPSRDLIAHPPLLDALIEGKESTARLLLDNGASIYLNTDMDFTDFMRDAPWTDWQEKSTQTWENWQDSSLTPENLTKENVMDLLCVWPLSSYKAPVPRIEHLDAIFKDARWKDEHAEHKLELIQQIPGLSPREQMFLMGGHARALMQRQNVDKEIER